MRYVIFCFLFFFQCLGATTVCLNMIVKNESLVIEDCLNSVKEAIDYWVIVDTGSTDNTKEIIRRVMKGIPGELHEASWVNFEFNRNHALNLAKGKGDYLLLIDADEMLLFSEPFAKGKLTTDIYFVTVKDQASGSFDFKRVIFINNHLDWRWKGVLHEELVPPPCVRMHETIDTIVNVANTKKSGRSLDPRKYYNDAEVLEAALKTDPCNARYVYYLAQSYFNAGEYELSLKNYEKRAAMGGWDQETFLSLYLSGMIREHLKMPPETIIDAYCQAYQFRPSRAEPCYSLAVYFISHGNYLLSYLLLLSAISLPMSTDVVYVQHWIYEYGLLEAYAEVANKLGKIEEAKQAYELLLKRGKVPPAVQARAREALENFN